MILLLAFYFCKFVLEIASKFTIGNDYAAVYSYSLQIYSAKCDDVCLTG